MKLFLKDKKGTKVYEGRSFGTEVKENIFGEVVFNTSMVGYVESLTDPSYAGQILVCTYPLVGNYGVPDKKDWESEKIQVAGLIVSEYCDSPVHSDSEQTLSEWLKFHNIPAIQGVDTRELTKKLREHGVMLGSLGEKVPKKFLDPNVENLVAKVSCAEVKTYKNNSKNKSEIKIVAVDCGMKENIVRSFLKTGDELKINLRITRVSWDYNFNDLEYDGLFLSNGPGDPTQCAETIKNIKTAVKNKKPILGICLGNQLLGLATGAKTYKLKYGHRSQNQPCVNLEDGKCCITSQNHGFAIDEKTLDRNWKVWFVNGNDKTLEGIKHKTLPMYSVQFHPEAAPGPTDTAWIFEKFLHDVAKGSQKTHSPQSLPQRGPTPSSTEFFVKRTTNKNKQ
jgi:carbamoyl-phosphate synthase small subunit